MQDFSVYSDIIKDQILTNGIPSSDTIKAIISDHSGEAADIQKLYKRYNALPGGAPILDRTRKVETKVNNRISHNYMRKIVDTKAGYYASKISYQLDKNAYGDNEAAYNEASEVIQDFLIRSSAPKLDSQVARDAGICGYGVKSLYIDDSQINATILNPWECVSIQPGELALRYYNRARIGSDGKRVLYITADLYDSNNIYRFTQAESGYVYVETIPHLIGMMPLVFYRNNAEGTPDCDASVLTLIDAYDVVMSDAVNDLEQVANAYLLLTGMSLGNTATEQAENLKNIRESGVISTEKDSNAAFITKAVNDTFLQNVLKKIEQNIFSFASSINLNDENFSSNASGVAMKYKMLGLETVSQLSTNEFKAATYQLFKAACALWSIKDVVISPVNIYIDMKRNFPLDLLSEAQASAMLKGMVSERTRLAQLSFVDDVDYEVKQMEADSDPYDLDQTNNESGNDNGEDGTAA